MPDRTLTKSKCTKVAKDRQTNCNFSKYLIFLTSMLNLVNVLT